MTLEPASRSFQARPRVLLVEESDEMCALLSAALGRRGVDVLRVWEGDVALKHAREIAVRSVLVDVDLLGQETADLVANLKRMRKDLPVIAFANGAPEQLLDRVRHSGVVELLRKPVAVSALVRLVIRHGGLPEALEFVEIDTHGHRSLWSEATRTIYEEISRSARSDAPLLITGETGTGKEVAARTAHEISARRRGPFVAVNCPALSAGLMESELFGHEKGAFTNATSARVGRFEAARGGTILLDEVSELESGLQAKLLRVLQERTFERVGSNDVRKADVRVIATSNRDLEREVAAGRFRLDLYHRLKVYDVRIPSLRDRRAEVALFLDYFCGLRGVNLSAHARSRLLGYSWPGNVREVENLIEQLAGREEKGGIALDQLPAEFRRPESPEVAADPGPCLTLAENLALIERQTIESALRRAGGNRIRAAELLGIGRSTLQAKLRRMGLVSALELAKDGIAAGE